MSKRMRKSKSPRNPGVQVKLVDLGSTGRSCMIVGEVRVSVC